MNRHLATLANAARYLRVIVAISLIAAGVSVVSSTAIAKDWRAKSDRRPDASDDFFAKGVIPELRVEIAEAELNKLRQDARKYVKGKLTEDGSTVFAEVGVKLKGAAGSFRGVDDRPALTINMDKFYRDQTFHALQKFHLNNSVQDDTLLNELICSHIFREAGIATPRVTHARVWVNNRDLGMYVLKEGFDQSFIKRHFNDSRGNFYEGGFLREIDGELEKEWGRGPDDRSDLAALVNACRMPKLEERWPAIEQHLNVDQFLTFMAIEIMTCHWDGYCRNRNNYRVYFEPITKQFHFLPHGMDQMFGDSNASLAERPGAFICQSVLANPDWEMRYKRRIRDLQPLFNPPDKLHKLVDDVTARLVPALAKIHPDRARDQENKSKAVKDRLTARANAIRDQLRAEPYPLVFNEQGEAAIPEWYEKLETPGAKLEQLAPPGQPKLMVIDTAQLTNCVASFRANVLLPPGKYKLVGRAKANDLVPTESGSGKGAGLRISGGQRMNQLAGTVDWTPLEHPFEVPSLTRVELVAELRAMKGQVTFDAGSLKIVRVKTP